MVRIYNETEDSYMSVSEYIDAYATTDEDTYYIQFVFELDDLFEKAKKRTAMRGNHAKDEQGNSLLERYALTGDEEGFAQEMLEVGSGELFRKLLAWTKNIFKSYQFNVLYDFGDTEEEVSYTGVIDQVESNLIFNDASVEFTSDDEGKTIEFTSGALSGQSAVIDTIIDGGYFDGYIAINDDLGDPTGCAFKIYEMVAAESASLQYFISMMTTPYMDLFEVVEAKMDEAIVAYVIKEWYRISGLYQDAQIEESRFTSMVKEIKSLLMMKATPTRRRCGFFKDFTINT